MRIEFKTKKLSKIFNSQQELIKNYGVKQAQKIQIRMAVLRSATCLAEIPSIKPDRCHSLKGERKGQYAVDLKQPFRLIFKPKDPIALLENGSVDTTKVFEIIILKVEDYHGN